MCGSPHSAHCKQFNILQVPSVKTHPSPTSQPHFLGSIWHSHRDTESQDPCMANPGTRVHSANTWPVLQHPSVTLLAPMKNIRRCRPQPQLTRHHLSPCPTNVPLLLCVLGPPGLFHAGWVNPKSLPGLCLHLQTQEAHPQSHQERRDVPSQRQRLAWQPAQPSASYAFGYSQAPCPHPPLWSEPGY